MIEVNSILFMGLWELVLLLLAVDVVVIVRFVIRRRREKASIDRLVTLVRQDAERRKQETRKLLEKKYGYSDEQLDKTTNKIIREEKRIYQILANLFTTRDNLAIENLSITFEEAVEPYRTLEIPKSVETKEGGGEDGGAEIQRLKELNKTLSEELGVTMNTISRMLHEYSEMFPEEGAGNTDHDAVAELLIKNQSVEDSPEIVAEDNIVTVADDMSTSATASSQGGDGAVEETPKEGTVDDEEVDSAVLVGMFQEDDDLLTEDNEIAEASSLVGDDLGSPQEPGSFVEKSELVEDVLAQEIDNTLENHDTDAIDIGVTAKDSNAAEAEVDPVEELLAQAIGETFASHETPLPEFVEEEFEEEAEATDPAEELLAQAINETLESHETELPDIQKEEVLDDQNAEKLLADEVSATLSNPSEELSDEDIDSLLQSATEGAAEK